MTLAAQGMPQRYADLMKGASRVLQLAGVENPRREARLLMALAADLSTADLIATELMPVADAGVQARFDAYVKRRAAREPFAHIAGHKSFFGLTLKSDGRALVPRPDSEVLVEAALDLLPRGRAFTVADLGTGSGCLLAAILAARGRGRGIAVEADPDAAALARENFRRHGVDDRIDLVVADWSVSTQWTCADLIVSNPPYVRSADLYGLDAEVQRYDPRAALDGGADGLCAYRNILAVAAGRVAPGTPVLFEIGYDQGAEVTQLLGDNGFSNVSLLSDFSGHDRVVTGYAGSVNSGK